MSRTVRVTNATRRRFGPSSPHGFNIAIEYITEGEAGYEMEWLEDFLAEFCGPDSEDTTILVGEIDG